MFMKNNNYQDKKNKLDKEDISYICTCQFFFDNINEIEQKIIEKDHNQIYNHEMINKKTLKFNVVAIYNLLKQANIAKDCLMLWQWKLDDNQIISCTLIGYDNNNRVNMLTISLKNWLITDQLETIIEEGNDKQSFIHPYKQAAYIYQTIKPYLSTINNTGDIILKTCVYLPFYDFSLNNPENFKTLTGQEIFNPQIINLVCNYNFNINANFFYSNNKAFLITQIKTMFFKGKGMQVFAQLFEKQTANDNNITIEQKQTAIKTQKKDITEDIIVEKPFSIKNNESKPIFVSSNLKSQDNSLTAITIALPKHCFDGFYDQTLKLLSKRFAKIKYIKANQFILIPLANFKTYIVNNKGENIAVDNDSAFDFFEIKLNNQQEVIIMQQVQTGKIVQYKKIDPSNLKLHFSKEINEANLIKNNKSLTKMNMLRR